MAIVFDDKQKKDEGGAQPQDQGGGTPVGAQATESAFSTAPSTSAPVSSAGVGSGGTGGWTNIQSYLTANAGGSKSSDVLKSTVGGQFDKEKTEFERSSGDARGAGQKELDRTLNTDQASRVLNTISGQYAYKGPQSSAYTSGVNQLQGAMQNYGGPSSYSYGMGADTQRYGDGLKSDQSFQTIMGDLYRNAAGGQMGQGAMSLQRQIDQDNPLLNTARTDLSGQYSGLQNTIDSGVKDTNKFLGDAQTTVNTNAAALPGMFDRQRGTDQRTINTAVQGAQKDLNTILADLDARASSPDWQFSWGGVMPTAETLMGMSGQRSRYNTVLDVLKDEGKRYGSSNQVYDPSRMTANAYNPTSGVKEAYSLNDIAKNPAYATYRENNISPEALAVINRILGAGQPGLVSAPVSIGRRI